MAINTKLQLSAGNDTAPRVVSAAATREAQAQRKKARTMAKQQTAAIIAAATGPLARINALASSAEKVKHATHPVATDAISYDGYRFPPDMSSYMGWLHYRFPLSLNMVDELLAARSMDGGRETFEVRLSHRGYYFSVILVKRLDCRWTWSYALHGLLIVGVKDPVFGEIMAAVRAVRAAMAHIDGLIESCNPASVMSLR
jgi:hypothetical protein